MSKVFHLAEARKQLALALDWFYPDNPLPSLIDQCHHQLEQLSDSSQTESGAIRSVLACAYWLSGEPQPALNHARQSSGEVLSRWVLVSQHLRLGQLGAGLLGLVGLAGRSSLLAGLVRRTLAHESSQLVQVAPFLAGVLGVFRFGLNAVCLGFQPDLWRPCFTRKKFWHVLASARHPQQLLEQLAVLLPGSAGVLLGLAHAHQQQGYWDTAQRMYDAVLDRHPGYIPAWLGQIQLLVATQQWDALALTLDRVQTLQPANVRVACHQGHLAYLQKQLPKAMMHYQQALQLAKDPASQSQLLQLLADVYLEPAWQDLPAAQQALLHALSITPQDVSLHQRLCILYNQSGQLELARDLCRKALARQPKAGQWYTNLGFIAWRQEDLTEAIQSYQQALAINPQDEVAANNLSVIYLEETGAPAKAAHLLEGLIKHKPHYALAYFNLGRAYSMMGQTVEAARAYHQAQRLNVTTRELDEKDLQERLTTLFD